MESQYGVWGEGRENGWGKGAQGTALNKQHDSHPHTELGDPLSHTFSTSPGSKACVIMGIPLIPPVMESSNVVEWESLWNSG